MDMINGMKVISSPYIQPVPKLQLRSDFTACSDAMRHHINDWLLKRFGTYFPVYVIGRDLIVAASITAEKIRAAQFQFDDREGGAA